MSKPKPRLIDMTIEVPADRGTVWKALTEGQGIANWFPQFCEAEPGVGGKVHLSWGPECEWDTFVSHWQPLEYLRWQDDLNDQSDNPYAVEFHLEADGESTRVRLVQSGFSHGDEFEEMYQGVKAGWTYFLYNLQNYLRFHLGKNREMLKESTKFLGTRAQIWQRLLLASGGLVVNPPPAIDLGLELNLSFGGSSTICGIVDVLVPERTIGIRLPDNDNALFFIEIEPGAEDTTCGFWFSTYGQPAPAKLAVEFYATVGRLAEPVQG